MPARRHFAEEMKDAPDAMELRYLRAYQGFIYQFNMLDRNIAYCLASARKRPDESATIERFLSFSFDQKVKKLKALVGRSGIELPFQEFFSIVEHCRIMRNKIVHGNWEFGDFLDGPIRFHIPAPVAERGSYTLDSFERELEQFKAAIRVFFELREKHDLTNLKSTIRGIEPGEARPPGQK